MGASAQRGFVLVISLLDAVDVPVTRCTLDADGLYRVVEAKHLYWDDRALSAESDRHCCAIRATVGIIW